MISRIDHVSIAVKDYDRAFRFFQTLLGAIPGACDDDPSMKYLWQIFSLGDLSRLELMKTTGEGSFLDNFLSEKAEGGVHHITMETPDIEKMRRTLEEHRIPYFGYRLLGDRWKELFIHPRDAFGVLIQIAEFHPDDWLAPAVKLPSGRYRITRNSEGCTLAFAHPGGGKVSLAFTKEEIRRLADDLGTILKELEAEEAPSVRE